MRVAYNEQMTELADMLGEMAGLAGAAMERATQSLLQADLVPRRAGHRRHDKITELSTICEERAFALLALQAPVAGDLRSVVSGIQIVADIDRMGALALHVAKIARRRHPNHVLPEEVNGYFAEMGRIAVASAQPPARSSSRPATPSAPRACAKKTTRWTTSTATCSPS